MGMTTATRRCKPLLRPDAGGPTPINARAEAGLDQPMFREPFLNRHCVGG
jgi:hypothetical protein